MCQPIYEAVCIYFSPQTCDFGVIIIILKVIKLILRKASSLPKITQMVNKDPRCGTRLS